MKKLVAIVALVAAAYAGYRWGPAVFPPLERLLADGEAAEERVNPRVEPTPETAEAALDRFEALRRGEGGNRLALGGPELSSVVRFALPGIIPPGVAEPTVRLEEGRVALSARVAVEAFPRLPNLDDVVGMLPDTVLVEIRGTLAAYDRAVMALMVDRLQVARIPLPRRMVSKVLDGLGREGPRGFPEDALPVPLPDGLASVSVQADSLVLIAEEGG